ncbi:MAG TPA: histidine kinase [Candidatus Angelobacter sp.]|nr:histidine kinase [Candidatus Angelobacter sp.]
MLSLRRWQPWAVSFLCWTLYAIFDSAGSYALIRSAGEHPVLQRVIGWNFSYAYFWVLVTPPIFAIATRYGFSRGRWKKPLVVHTAACLAVTTVVSWLFIRWSMLLGWADLSTSLRVRFLDLGLENLPRCVATMGLAHAVAYYARYREREMQSSRLEASLAQAQLEILRSQVEPHFLFNALNSIATLARRDPASAERMTLQLAVLLRVSLDCVGSQEVSLQQELEFLQNYLEIQKTRFHDRLTIHLKVDSDLLSVPVPSLILQPLVENAIRHGIAQSATAGCVEISAAKHNGTMAIEVVDSGAGTSQGSVEKSLGVGLRNTRARLQQLYGSRSEFVLENIPGGGCRVRLAIPLPALASMRDAH